MLKYINHSPENLYKSLAIGSLVVLLLGSVLMAAELQSLAADQARLDSQISVHNLVVKLADHAHAEREQQFAQDSLSYAADRQSIAQARAEEREYGFAVQFPVGAKTYTIKQYEDSVTRNYKLRAAAYVSQKAKEQRQGLLATRASRQAEHQAQRANNLLYYKVLLCLWVVLLVLSAVLGRYGYRKWKELEQLREADEEPPLAAPRGRHRPIL